MSNSSRSFSDVLSMTLFLSMWRLENVSDSLSFRIMFSLTDIEGTIPSVFLSSGMYPIPFEITCPGERFWICLPKSSIVPLSVFLIPLMASASSLCPFPDTPARPTISPDFTVRL